MVFTRLSRVRIFMGWGGQGRGVGEVGKGGEGGKLIFHGEK